ncbi:MAG TPA: oligosaccharide flippase family protein [Thermoanaerobaculia bacterium]|nr:oligosaccharide flippase family protein [Thermoanaerobaculia bacterium]
MSTERRVLRSTLAGYTIQLARMLIGFFAKLILARLLLPDTHGLYDEALRIVTVASAVRDLGLPYHLVRDSRRPYGTVLVSTLVLGLVISVLLFGGAPVFGFLHPDLPKVLQVFAIWVFLDGLAVVPKAFFERELTIGRLIGPEVLRGAVIAAVSIGLAWAGWGVWAFVAADLAGATLLAAYSWWQAWGKIPLRADLHLLPDLIRRSSWLFWIWISLQLVTYLDIYIVEIFDTTDSVGLYGKAYMVAFLVATIVYPRALFPTLVEYLEDRPRFLEAFRLSALQLLGLQVVASYFLFFNAEKVVWVLFGNNWSGAAPLLRVLAFVPFLDQFTILGGEMLKARHQDRTWLAIMLLNLVSLVGFGVYFTQHWGAPGMAAANYLLAGNLVMAWQVGRAFGPRFGRFMGDLALVYLIPLPFFAASAWFFEADSWPRFAASLAAAALAAAILVFRYWGPFRAFFGK